MRRDGSSPSSQESGRRISIWVVKWCVAWRPLSRFNLDSVLPLASFALLLLIFVYVCFVGIKQLCGNLMAVQVIGPLIIRRSFSLGLLTLFFLVAFSQLVTCYAHLFQSRELSLLHHAPLSSREIFSPQASETLLKGVWIATLFILTILVAYGRGREASWPHFLLSLVGVIPFLLIASGLGMLIMVLVAWLVIGRRYREWLLLGAAVMAGLLLLVWSQNAVSWVSATDPVKKLGETLANLRISTNPYLPSHWLSELVEASIERRTRDALHMLVLLSSTAWLFFTFLWFLGGRIYRSAWLSCRDRGSRRRSRGRKMWFGFPFSLLPRWFRSLLVKEWFIFRRDFSQWGQFLLILGLVLLYVVQVRGRTVPDDAFRMRSAVVFFNVLLLGFIQATLALRYAFPSVSLEGRSFWAVRKSPVGTRRYFMGKYMCHFLWILAVGEVIILLLSQILRLEQPFSTLAVTIVAVLSLGFTSCTVGLGALYPRFDAPSTADISSGAGALVSMILTLSYLAFSAAILARLFLNVLPFRGVSFLDGKGVEGLAILAGGFVCKWISFLLPESAEVWFLAHLPLDSVWGVLDANTTILITIFLALQAAAIICPARAGMRRLEELSL